SILSLLEKHAGFDKGLDEQGDLALVLTSIEPTPKAVAFIPVANFTDFFAAIHADDPGNGVAEAQVAGQQALVGRKGSYAVLAHAGDRDALERVLASTDKVALDGPLREWLEANQLSVVATTR